MQVELIKPSLSSHERSKSKIYLNIGLVQRIDGRLLNSATMSQLKSQIIGYRHNLVTSLPPNSPKQSFGSQRRLFPGLYTQAEPTLKFKRLRKRSLASSLKNCSYVLFYTCNRKSTLRLDFRIQAVPWLDTDSTSTIQKQKEEFITSVRIVCPEEILPTLHFLLKCNTSRIFKSKEKNDDKYYCLVVLPIVVDICQTTLLARSCNT